MTTTDHIEYEAANHVAHIRLNRPAKRNAFTLDMFAGITAAFTRADDDDDVRCIVLSANGQDFTTGLDLANVAPAFASGEVPIREEDVDPWEVAGRARKTPLIMAAHGRCFTLGFELALASDIVVAAEGTVFNLREPRIGIIPAGGGTFRFVSAAGWSNAMRWVLTGQDFDAAEAYRLRAIQEIVPAGTQLERATALADMVASNAPLAVRAARENAHLGVYEGHAAAAKHAVQSQMRLARTADAMEGMRAVMERRMPSFTGN